MLPTNSVKSRHVRRADRRVRLGLKAAVRRLESGEPVLASFVLENAGDLYAQLDRACCSHAEVRAIHRAAVRLTLVAIEATRRFA